VLLLLVVVVVEVVVVVIVVVGVVVVVVGVVVVAVGVVVVAVGVVVVPLVEVSRDVCLLCNTKKSVPECVKYNAVRGTCPLLWSTNVRRRTVPACS
jgi:hypothetical protein